MKVLLTGATGFIGSVLLSSLAHEIVVLGRKKPTSKDVGFFMADIDTLGDYSKALKGVDVLIHLAARVHVMKEKSLDPLLEFRKTNVEATVNLASQAAHAGVKRFIFISSAGVYGDSSVLDVTERVLASPAELFAVSKLEAEQKLLELCSNTGMGLIILRPPMVYGEQAPGNFGLMVRLIQTGLPIPLGDIGNSRSFVSVWNLVDLINTCIDHPEAVDETFVVCDQGNLSTSDFLVAIGRGLGAPVRLFSFPSVLLKFCAKLLGKHKVYNRLFSSFTIDDSYTRRTLDWEPPLSIDEGMRRCFKNNIEI